MPPALRIKILLLTLIRTLVNTMHRMVYPLLPTLARGVGVSVETFTLALTARALLSAASPIIGSISDQRGRKVGMLIGLTLFLAGTGLVIVWPSFPGLVIAMLLATTGKYVLDPSIHAYVGDQVPYTQRAQAIALLEFGWSLSFILGIPLAGFMIARAGWLAPFPLFAGLAILSIFLILQQVPNDAPPRPHQHPTTTGAGETTPPPKSATLWAGLREILMHPSAVAGLLFGLFMSSANETVNIVFGLWLEQSFSLQVAALGAASLVIGVSELGGESMASVITDRVGKKRAITGGLVLNSLMALALPVLGQTLPGALVGLFLFYLTFEFTIVSAIPIMTEILPTRRATLLAVNISAFSVGRALASWLATPVFAWGILASAGLSVGFNLLALVALRRIRLEEAHERRPTDAHA
ncbi:MAG: MFS transporter [Anaerolineales bacterium]|nr:MFS transporter [Anaerolineales bacterium]